MSTLKPFYQDRNIQAGDVQKTEETPNIVFPAVLACLSCVLSWKTPEETKTLFRKGQAPILTGNVVGG